MDQFASPLPTHELIEQLITQGENEQLRQLLETIHPTDIARLLDDLSAQDGVTLFELLPVTVGSEVLDETHSLVRQELVDRLDDEHLADLIQELPMDDAVEFLEDLPDEVSDRLIDLMEPEDAEEVRELMAYEEETAGRLMITNVAVLRRHWSVLEALDYLRSLNDAETLHYLYVVDRHGKLIGVTPLRALILSQPDTTIDAIMSTDIVAARVTADQEELAEMVARYDYFAIPIVDDENKLLGVVTVDDVVDIFEEEATEDIQRLGGSEPLDQPYFAATMWQVVQKRIGWLLLLFVAATLTGTVLRIFEEELVLVVALSFFIPLITGTGGNAGSQTVATIIRALTLGEVRLANIGQAWLREVSAGLILGLAMGVVGFVRAILWRTGYDVALVVTLTLPIVVIWANTIATLVPIIANHFHIDPTVISGPMITTIVDATGLVIYFLLAKLLLGL